MAMKKVFKEMPFAGNLHLRFDEGEDASAATSRRGTLFYLMKHEEKLFSVLLFALAALANCAKADIVAAQEHLDENGNIKSITVNDPNAQIGTVKTPWMFVRPDGKSGFANDFTTNAISVVSEDGETYYAHVKGQDNDRTKVIKFTIDKNGIPSKIGTPIDTTESREVNNAEAMKNRKLVGVTDGTLCFYPTESYGTALIYNPETKEVFHDETGGSSDTQKCLASCQGERGEVYVLRNYVEPGNGVTNKTTQIIKICMGGQEISPGYSLTPLSDENRVMAHRNGSRYYIGDSEGNVIVYNGSELWTFNRVMPGPISGITVSDRGPDVFVTSTKTNAFYNAGLSGDTKYNVVSNEDPFGGDPVVPQTNEGLIRIIDNRRKGGKLMCITTKGIHSMDD